MSLGDCDSEDDEESFSCSHPVEGVPSVSAFEQHLEKISLGTGQRSKRSSRITYR